MINPSVLSAHGKRFLSGSVEDAGGMTEGKESHLFIMLFVIVTFSCPITHAFLPVSYYVALSFHEGVLAGKFLMDAKEME